MLDQFTSDFDSFASIITLYDRNRGYRRWPTLSKKFSDDDDLLRRFYFPLACSQIGIHYQDQVLHL